MPTNFANWTSRVAIAARVAECERRSRGWDEWVPDDYHGPFGHGQARAEGARLLWQFYSPPPNGCRSLLGRGRLHMMRDNGEAIRWAERAVSNQYRPHLWLLPLVTSTVVEV
jgi:hypothetical protein